MDFKRMVDILPVDWEVALGSGMSWFINKQDPKRVEFEVNRSGYMIKVYTDEESAEKAKSFGRSLWMINFEVI